MGNRGTVLNANGAPHLFIIETRRSRFVRHFPSGTSGSGFARVRMAGADDRGIVVDGDDDVVQVDHALSMMRLLGRFDANGLSRK